jgi:molybdate transport system regulatory protein
MTSMSAPVIRFRIDFANNCYVGPGKIDLLEAIHRSGSLSQAARDLGMSYRRAWLLVDSLKSSFRESVTIAETGGKGGGGVTLTQFGRQLIRSYRALERDIAQVASRRLRQVAPAVSVRAAARSVSPPKVLARRRRGKTAR